MNDLVCTSRVAATCQLCRNAAMLEVDGMLLMLEAAVMLCMQQSSMDSNTHMTA